MNIEYDHFLMESIAWLSIGGSRLLAVRATCYSLVGGVSVKGSLARSNGVPW